MIHPAGRMLLVTALALMAACQAAPRPAPGPLTRVDSLVDEGERRYLAGEFESAVNVWNEALAHAASDDHASRARIGTWMGLAAYRQGRYSEARRLGEDALALKHRYGLAAELAVSYNALGLLAWNEGRLGDARGHFSRALEEARRRNDAPYIARASNSLGLVQVEVGAFNDARANFVVARNAGHDLNDSRLEGGGRANLAMVAIWSGDPSAALPELAKAESLYRDIGYETGLETVYGQRASAHTALGEPHLAFLALDSALAIARRQGMRAEESLDLETRAHLFRSVGDTRRALESFAAARTINHELGQVVELGTNLRSEAEIRGAAGLLDRARSDAREALRVHAAAGARWQMLHDLLLLAELEHRAGDTASAEWRLAAARSLADSLATPVARAAAALGEARLADRSGAARRVLQALEAVGADLALAVPDGAEPEALRARAYASLGLLDSAVAAGRRAVAAGERVRARLGSGASSDGFERAGAPAYADLVMALLRLGHTEEAFEVADGVRGRALLERLAGVRRDIRDSSVRQAAEAERLLRRIDALVVRLEQTRSNAVEERGSPREAGRYVEEELARRLAAARDEYELLRFRARSGAAEAELLGLRTTTATELRSALLENELLLEYLVRPERLIVFAVTRDTSVALVTPMREEELIARVRLARGVIGRHGSTAEESRDVAAALHQALLAPLARAGLLQSARRIIVVPHGALAYLPFAALQDPAGRPLAATHGVVSVPSAAGFVALRRRTAEAGGFSRALVFAPFPELLPGTRAEAEAISRVLPGSAARLAAAATEPQVRRALAGDEIVHVASHGVLEAGNPMFSRLELERGRRGSTDHADDGRLEVHELLDLSVRSPLVFLSGCETGLGTAWSTAFARGEDMTTLAQAFLHAGARHVIATLWPIEDDGGAVFAERFYRRLAWLPPGEALAAAQRDMYQDPRYAAPYHWAGYILLGDPGAPVPTGAAQTARAGP